ncbi:hypothetical protein V5799_008827 [Amblyomma americanum]|uniref:ERAP1-like C-terminal domain-containing protein n=1 Tax=Amblyomma americanum TaxID=6943 RepID=A0AAQ4FCU9_AMBAM
MRIVEGLVSVRENGSIVLDLFVVPRLVHLAASGAGFIVLRQDVFDSQRPWQSRNWLITVVHHMLVQYFLSYATPRTIRDIWIAESLAYVYQRKVLSRMGLGSTINRLRLLDRRKAMEADDNRRDGGALRARLLFSMLSDLCPETASSKDTTVKWVSVSRFTHFTARRRKIIRAANNCVHGCVGVVGRVFSWVKLSSKSNLIVRLRIQSGIHRYLSTNEYGVADDRTFWQTLHPSGVLSRNMDTWANYGGYPVLSALRVSDDRGPALVLKQGWHCFVDLECNATLVWTVPFSVTVEGRYRFPQNGARFLRGTIQRYQMSQDMMSSWLLLNTGTVSYFRVQYDAENIALLTNQLLHNNSVLPETARALFLDDMVALAVRRMVSIDALVGFLTYLPVRRFIYMHFLS